MPVGDTTALCILTSDVRNENARVSYKTYWQVKGRDTFEAEMKQAKGNTTGSRILTVPQVRLGASRREGQEELSVPCLRKVEKIKKGLKYQPTMW